MLILFFASFPLKPFFSSAHFLFLENEKHTDQIFC